MTKSKGVGRGGARPGSGPKPKPRAPASSVRQLPQGISPEDFLSIARAHTVAAFETLAVIASDGASELARVSAARLILEYAVGKPAPKPEQLPTKSVEDAGWEADLGPDLPIGAHLAPPFRQ